MFESPMHNGPKSPGTPTLNTMTPWGRVQHTHESIFGVMFVTTERHGGMWVHSRRLALMPESMRSHDGWYEEDCDAALVVVAFPQFFDVENVVRAKSAVKAMHSATASTPTLTPAIRTSSASTARCKPTRGAWGRMTLGC